MGHKYNANIVRALFNKFFKIPIYEIFIEMLFKKRKERNFTKKKKKKKRRVIIKFKYKSIR